MTFILILLLWSASHSNQATAIEFTSQEKCEFAGKASQAGFDGYNVHTYWVCVPK